MQLFFDDSGEKVLPLRDPYLWHTFKRMVDLRPLLPYSVRQLLHNLELKSYSQLHAAVSGKRRIPAELAIRIADLTGIPPSVIRPDLWKPKKKAA